MCTIATEQRGSGLVSHLEAFVACKQSAACLDLIGEGVVIVGHHVGGERAAGAGLHLGSDPTNVLLQLQQTQTLLQTHAAHMQCAIRCVSVHNVCVCLWAPSLNWAVY